MKSKIGPIVTVVIWTSLSMAAQQVSARYDRDYDFSKVRKFSVEVAPSWSNPALAAYVKQTVSNQLHARGWNEVPDESQADLRVVVKGTVKTRKYDETYYNGGMMGISGVSSPAGVISGRTIKQTLAEGEINMFDTRTSELVFTGTGVGEVSSKEKTNEHRIKKGLEKVLKALPVKRAA